MFLSNLSQVFTYDGDIYTRWLLNTILYAGVGAVLATLFAAAAGYVLAKYEFRGKRALFNLVLAGLRVPGTALALPMYQLFASVNLVNTYWAVLIPSLVSPFGVYLSRIYAEAAVSDSVLEAARVDGSGEVRIFFRIVLRTLTPVLVTVFLFQFVGIWNNYFLPLVMLSSNTLYPIALGLTTWQAGSVREPQLLQTTIGGARTRWRRGPPRLLSSPLRPMAGYHHAPLRGWPRDLRGDGAQPAPGGSAGRLGQPGGWRLLLARAAGVGHLRQCPQPLRPTAQICAQLVLGRCRPPRAGAGDGRAGRRRVCCQ